MYAFGNASRELNVRFQRRLRRRQPVPSQRVRQHGRVALGLYTTVSGPIGLCDHIIRRHLLLAVLAVRPPAGVTGRCLPRGRGRRRFCRVLRRRLLVVFDVGLPAAQKQARDSASRSGRGTSRSGFEAPDACSCGPRERDRSRSVIRCTTGHVGFLGGFFFVE